MPHRFSLPPGGGGDARWEQAPPFRNPPLCPGSWGRLRRIPSGRGATPGGQGRRTQSLGRSPFLRAAAPPPFCSRGGGLGWGGRWCWRPMAEHLLDVRGLRTHFPTRDGLVRAVDGVDLYVDPGETLGIVGESGSGKSMTGLSV